MKKFILNGLIACFAIAFNGISQNTINFNYTGTAQSWTVPNCCNSITVTVAGAQGGGSNGGPGGNGGQVTATIAVIPGQVLQINVGGAGGAGAAGWNGGGAGWPGGGPGGSSGGGGGASDIRFTPYALANRVIVAAGGGGSAGGTPAYAETGGAGGCATGVNGIGSIFTGPGGTGGSQTAGGIGGNFYPGGQLGQNGSLGQGGNGGMWGDASGGGAGGGYYGGGGGGSDGCCSGANGGAGGGGGSSFVPAGGACVAGSNSGNGFISITYTGGLTATANNTGPYCVGETIQLNGGGGVNYSWTGPNGFTSNLQNPTIPTSTVAMSGMYQVIVTDPICPISDTATTTVLVKPMPTVDPVSDQQLCNGSSTNAVNFTGVEPGTVYSWTNTNTSTGLAAAGAGNIAAFTGSAVAGTEVSNITVTPSLNGCVGTPEMFSITVLLDPALTVSNDTLICENGTAYLVATASGGGGGPYLYHWDHTASTLGYQNEGPASATTYTVYGESANGCLTAPQTIDVTVRPPLTGTISPVDTVCPTYPADLMATVVGGLGVPYTFVWSNANTQTGPANHTVTVTPNVSTNYSVTVTDGCESTPLVMNTNVRVSPLPVPQFQVLNPEQCEPAVFDVVNTTDPSLSQYVYWLVDGQFQYLNQDTIITPELWAGDYNIQMIVTTYEGCVDSNTFVNALYVQPMPVADFRFAPSPVTMFNTDVNFANYSINGYSYQWYFEGGYPDESTQEDVDVHYPDGVIATYDVMLITTSELGCIDTAYQEVIVHPEVIIYAPNSFTPDNDEHNQDWKIFMEGIDVYDFELLIFDRWGEVVWESHDISIAWDGTFKGKELPSGTYTWIVRTKDILNDGKYTYTGHMSILR